jgi:hypothetical protein
MIYDTLVHLASCASKHAIASIGAAQPRAQPTIATGEWLNYITLTDFEAI